MLSLRNPLALCSLVALSLTISAQTPITKQDTEPVIHDLCNKRVALLGESPVHGFGETLDFKVALVHRLIEECHYNALLVESPAYDFIHIRNVLAAHDHVTEDMIFSAIGGLWRNQEVQALVPFLTQKVNAGSLTLGGLDDQLGRGTWAPQAMPAKLVQYLPIEEQSRCLAILHRNTLWQYTDAAPYSPADKTKILGCLDGIGSLIPQSKQRGSATEDGDRMMIDSLKRNYARSFTEDDFSKPDQSLKWINDRDRSMYLNFQWWLAKLPPRSKIIVWAATVHTAKELTSVPTFEGRIPLGSYIHRDFAEKAFTLGFTALSGSYITVRPPAHDLSAAPADSLEVRSFLGGSAETHYLPYDQLVKLGSIPARPLGTSFTATRWSDVLDGLIVFRQERPPQVIPF